MTLQLSQADNDRAAGADSRLGEIDPLCFIAAISVVFFTTRFEETPLGAILA